MRSTLNPLSTDHGWCPQTPTDQPASRAAKQTQPRPGTHFTANTSRNYMIHCTGIRHHKQACPTQGPGLPSAPARTPRPMGIRSCKANIGAAPYKRPAHLYRFLHAQRQRSKADQCHTRCLLVPAGPKRQPTITPTVTSPPPARRLPFASHGWPCGRAGGHGQPAARHICSCGPEVLGQV